MSNRNELLTKILNKYSSFDQYRDVFVSSLSGEVTDSVDPSMVSRKYITTYSKVDGVRVEHMHCIRGECNLRRIIMWNYSRPFIWSEGRGWEAVNGLQSALAVVKVLVPYLLLESVSPVLQYLGVNEVVAQPGEHLGNVECDILELRRVAGAITRLWVDQRDSIVRKVEWSFPLSDNYGGSRGNVQIDLLSEISTEFEVDRTIFLPIGDGTVDRSI